MEPTGNNSQLVHTDHWQDVSCMNLVIFRRFYRDRGWDTTDIDNWIRLALQEEDPSPITDEKLVGEWLSLPSYQMVEEFVVDDLGHVVHFQELGRYAQKWSFESPAIDVLKRGLVPYFSEPDLGYREAPKGNKRFNRNKDIVIVKKKRGHCVLRLKYISGPGGVEARTAQKDIRSVLYFGTGMLRGIIDIWYKEDSAGHVRVKSADITPESVIQREAKLAGITMVVDTSNGLSINGQVHGELIELPSGTRAFIITKDVETPCRQCRDENGEPVWHPILQEGEVYRYKDEIPTEYDIHWRKNRLFTLGRLVNGSRLASELDDEQNLNTALMLAATARAETRAEQAEAAAALANLNVAVAFAEAQQARADAATADKKRLRTMFERAAPTLGMADDLLSGSFLPITLHSLILQTDVKGFKRLSEQWGPFETNIRMTRMFERLETMARKRGFYPFKRIGDALIIAHADWPRRSTEARPYQCIENAEDAMISMAEEFHHVAKVELGLTLRIGIAKGDVLWCNQTTDPEEIRFDASGGDALNLASRLESLAPPGSTAISDSIARSRKSREEVIPVPKSRSTITFRGRVPDKNGDPIEVWDVDDGNQPT